MRKLKQLLANKNVVTILGAILVVVVLYAFYNWRVDQATSPIKVPYAKVTIEARKEITSDMIGYLEIPQTSLKGNVLTNVNSQILGKYTNVNCVIPSGSLFYKDVVVKFEELPDSFLMQIPEDMVAYNFKVNTLTTYGNSMFPGNYVDVYFKGVDAGKIILGKLVQNVKILAVKDSNGQHVFESMTENRTPSQIIFAVSEEVSSLLRTAEYINNAQIILVPTNAAYRYETDTIVTEITNDQIVSYINANKK